MHDAVKGVMAQTGMLANAAAICAQARDAGCTVIHAPIVFREDNAKNPNKNLGILKGCADGSLFKASTWNAAFCPEMAPVEGDLIVSGKVGLDAFPNSDLDDLLEQSGASTVVLGGFLTSCCVESTMRSAYERGYNVITLTDCTADTSADAYKAATAGTFNLFSTPMSSAVFHEKYLAQAGGDMKQ